MALVETIAYDEMRVALGWAMVMSGGAAPPAPVVPSAPKMAPLVAKAAAAAAPAAKKVYRDCEPPTPTLTRPAAPCFHLIQRGPTLKAGPRSSIVRVPG